MKLFDRQFLPVVPAILPAAFLAIGPQWIGSASAQEWPTRQVTMVVPYAAGGTTDVVARVLSPALSKFLGQQVVVENVGGAGGMIGSSRVAKSSPDGYQFVLGNVGTHAQNQSLQKSPLYNAATDFVPVALLVDLPMLLIVRKELPVGNLPEFMAYAKANQAKMQYGSAGAGSPTHLACALLNSAIGIDVTHVPYRGGGPAIQDLFAGRIDYFCFNTGSILAQIAGGTVKAIAMLSRDRSLSLPDLATARKQGLKDFEVGNWMALFLPKGTPGPIVLKLHEAAVATLKASDVQARLKQLGAEPIAPNRGALANLQEFVESEIVKWASIIREANIKAD